MKALVLCAGKSTRIESIGKGKPKPLIPLGGKSILSRNLLWLAKSGVQDIRINLHYRPEEIIAEIGDGSQYGVSIQYVYEPEILGTAGAIKNLEEEWTDSFLVICGDNLINFSLDAFYETHKKNKALATLALFHREENLNTRIAGGQVLLSSSYIQDFIEGSQEILSPYVNAGAYFLEPKILDLIPPQSFYDFGKDLFPQMLQKNKPIAAHFIDGYCLGIDTPASYNVALQLLDQL